MEATCLFPPSNGDSCIEKSGSQSIRLIDGSNLIQVRLSLCRKPSIMTRCLFSGGSTLDNNKWWRSASFPFAKILNFSYRIKKRLIFSEFILVDLFRGSASFGQELCFIQVWLMRPSQEALNTFVFSPIYLVRAVLLSDPKAHEAHHSWVVGEQLQEKPHWQAAENPHEATETWERHPIE